MEKKLALAALFFLVVLFAGMYGAFYAEAGDNGGKEDGLKEVYDFLKECDNYYLATAEGDQPRVRSFGSLAIFEGKLYFFCDAIEADEEKNYRGIICQLPIFPRPGGAA
jgi:hypothetical protein